MVRQPYPVVGIGQTMFVSGANALPLRAVHAAQARGVGTETGVTRLVA